MPYSVIYGPPGTGKSTAIVNTLKDRINKGVPLDRIGLCSFTKASAQVLAKRTGITKNIGTIHSLCFKIIGAAKESVISHKSLRKFAKATGYTFTGKKIDEGVTGMTDGDFYLNLYNLEKSKDNKTPDYLKIYNESEMIGSYGDFNLFIGLYEKYKKQCDYIDFNDMLYKALDLEPLDIDILFVDEAQDLSRLQWKVINHWATKAKEIIIAGDDDQSIYIWAGADPRGMYKFTEKYNATITVLDQSYRIPLAVHTKAEKLIKNINNRKEKIYTPRDYKGEYNEYTDLYDLDIDYKQDCYILFRTHNIGLKNVEAFLKDKNIPYLKEDKQAPLQSEAYKALLLYAKVNKYKSVSILSESQKNKLKKYLTVSNIEAVIGKHWDSVFNIQDFDLYIYLKNIIDTYGFIELDDVKLKIATIHSVKGKEADRIILINDTGLRLYYSIDDIDNKHMEEQEIRTFYVAMTRAINRLDIVEGEYPFQLLT